MRKNVDKSRHPDNNKFMSDLLIEDCNMMDIDNLL